MEFYIDLTEFKMNERRPVCEELLKERAKATFKTQELTYLLDGGKEKTMRRKELGSYLFRIICNCVYLI